MHNYLTVYDVLPDLATGMTYEELLEYFPHLTKQDILACLNYTPEQEQQTLIVPKRNYYSTIVDVGFPDSHPSY